MTRARITRALMIVALLFCGATTARAQTNWGIGVQANGTIYFCDRGRNTVWRITPSGELTAAVDGVNCRVIVTTPLDGVIGETTPNDVTATRGVGLWEISAAGTRQWTVPQTMVPPPDRWLIRDAAGREYSWSGIGTGSQKSEIVVYDPSGLRTVVAGSQWGHADGYGVSAAFANVTGLALAPDDSIVVLDSGDVRRISPLGVVRTEALGVASNSRMGLISAPGLWAREQGVATDRAGNAVIVDPAAGRVVHVDRNGHATAIWEPAGLPQRISGGRWGWRPAGVAMMGRTYYVLDEWMGPALIADLIGSPRLSQVDDGGHVTRIATVSSAMVRSAAAALLVVLLSVAVRALRGRRAR